MIFYDIGLLKTQNEHNDRKSLVYFIKKKDKNSEDNVEKRLLVGTVAAFNKTQFGRLHEASALHINTIL